VFVPASLLVTGLGGCETAKRFAPPGFVKYEDLEKGIPPDATIQARIDARAVNEQAEFPNLAGAPTEPPQGIGRRNREAYLDGLARQRDQMQAALAKDEAFLKSEFNLETDGTVELTDADLPEKSARLNRILEEDRAAIEEERARPLPAPEDTSAAPSPEEPLD